MSAVAVQYVSFGRNATWGGPGKQWQNNHVHWSPRPFWHCARQQAAALANRSHYKLCRVPCTRTAMTLPAFSKVLFLLDSAYSWSMLATAAPLAPVVIRGSRNHGKKAMVATVPQDSCATLATRIHIRTASCRYDTSCSRHQWPHKLSGRAYQISWLPDVTWP